MLTRLLVFGGLFLIAIIGPQILFHFIRNREF